MRFVISPGDAGRSVTDFLTARIARVSKQDVRAWIGSGRVRVNGRATTPRQALAGGDEVSVELPEEEPEPDVPAERAELPVLYEDDCLVVLDKPAGIQVLPGRFGGATSVYDELLETFEEESTGGEFVKPHIVHRIDKETSGLLVVCKDEAASRALSRQFERREVEKTYLGIVEGAPSGGSGTIERPLEADPRWPGRMRLAAGRGKRGGKEAATEWAVRERWRSFALVEFRPRTGRTHQIRLHALSLGHPLLCDPLYGRRTELLLSEFKRGYKRKTGERERPLLARLALHAHMLAFAHPADGRRVEFASPLPKDLAVAVKMLVRYG